MTKKIVTRFPPSPTGYLHIGGARTALFNWLLTKKLKGTFILRIEDTDMERSSPEATKAIIESMKWLGLDWDKGPYFQSERYDFYNEKIELLLKNNKAYYCHCSPDELDQRREEAKQKGLKPKYDGKCRELGLGPAPGAAVRLKTPTAGSTAFNDFIKGTIQVENDELDDLILRRSNGSPTYHMAVVADDIDLGVNLIIRGDDHVNNTPRQILIYQALGESLPDYAHVPMILGADKTRLSKRHGATSVLAYREMGYLPQALLNSLVRLGWAWGDQEKFTVVEMIEKFSLENVGRSPGVFNSDKLLDLNAQYIRETSDWQLADLLIPFLNNIGVKAACDKKLVDVIKTLKNRSSTLLEMAEKAKFYFVDDLSYDEEADKKFLSSEAAVLMSEILHRLKNIDMFSQQAIEDIFSAYLDEKKIKLKQIAQSLRVALTGSSVSPGIFEIMEVLGKRETIKRIETAISHIKKKL